MANCLQMKKAHRISSGIREDWSLLMTTNFMSAPATPMAMMSFMNQVSRNKVMSSITIDSASRMAVMLVSALRDRQQMESMS